MKTPKFSHDDENLLIRWTHDCSAIHPVTGEPVVGEVHHDLPIGMTMWMIKSIDPLTVVPEIFCWDCGIAGSITDGKWVKA